MKIMCLNSWGGNLADKLLAYLSSEQPDILCLQEVVHSPATKSTWLTYRDSDHVLQQRANLFSDVAEALPLHNKTFCPAAEGELWDDRLAIASQWGLATYVHPSLTVISQMQGFVHRSYSPNGYGEHPRSRTAHAVCVYDRLKHRTISVTHMHGLRDLRGKFDTPDRLRQAHRLLQMSNGVSKDCDIRIICGDFNVEPQSETLSLLQDNGFFELVTARGFNGTRTSFYKKPGQFADYMLIDKSEAVLSFAVSHEPEVSDHCPLILVI
jgi:endonuclease/exonuclease/phosphatase family metal-dependent hydrolase